MDGCVYVDPVTGVAAYIPGKAGGASNVTCVEIPDPNAPCVTYASLRVDGVEICPLKVHKTPTKECITYCLKNHVGEIMISPTSTSATTFDIYWTDTDSSLSVANGTTVSFPYSTEYSGEITICSNDPCAEWTFRAVGMDSACPKPQTHYRYN